MVKKVYPIEQSVLYDVKNKNKNNIVITGNSMLHRIIRQCFSIVVVLEKITR